MRTLAVVCLLSIPGSAWALGTGEHQSLISQLEDATFARKQLKLLKSYAGKPFTGAQAKAVLEAFSHERNRLEALEVIAKGIPSSATEDVLEAFTFSNNREKARAMFSNAPASSGPASSGRPTGKNRCENYSLSPDAMNANSFISAAHWSNLERAIKSESFRGKKVSAMKHYLRQYPEGFSAEQIVKLIELFTFKRDKLNALKAVESRVVGLTSAEVTSIIKAYTFSDDKIAVLEILKDTIVDPKNAQQIIDAYTFKSKKDRARELLSNIKGRTHLWGTVRANKAVFVIDVSGSMSISGRHPDGSSRSRLEFMKADLTRVLREQMDASTQFDIITFSTGVSRWKGKTVAGTKSNVSSAIEYVAGLKAKGATNVHDALEAAFKTPGVDAIYLLTDGAPSAGKKRKPAAIRKAVLDWNRKIGLRLHTVALLAGSKGGADERKAHKFMYELAQQNCGQFRLVR